MSNSQHAASLAAKRVEVTLIAAHTHEGKDLESGATINVTERQKQFLERTKKIGATPTAAAPVEPKEI